MNRGRKLRTICPTILMPLIGIVFIIGALTLRYANTFTHAATADGLAPFHGTVSPLVARSHLDGPADANQHISLSIGLRPRNEAGLASYVQDISRRSSVNYHRFLTPAQVADVFGPGKDTYNAVLQFLHTSGFTVTQTFNHRLLVTFSSTIGQAEQVFHVTINTYTAPDGRIFYANSSDPLLPSSLLGFLQSISGLNNAVRLHHPPLPLHSLSTQATKANALSSCPGSGAGNPSVTNSYMTPDQMAGAYNLSGLYNAGYHGEGQTIAVFELDTFQMSDLLNYVSCFGHGHTAISTIVTGQGSVPTDAGVAEVELDAELVLSAAPQLGMLKIYEAANDTADTNAEWARIVQDAPPIVSTSWGECEQDVGQQEAQQENIFFTAAAAQGQSIFAASGDSGSAGCAFDSPPSNSCTASTALNAGDPAAQPNVIGVGGTTLTLSGSSYGNEGTWNNLPQNGTNGTCGGASGGGISQFWSAPGWQNAPGVNNSYSTGTLCGAPTGTICRETPDVSLNADPYNGYLLYCSSSAATCSSSGNWYIVGGTSAAAPMWAAMMAMANEMALKMGTFSLGFVNPLLYQVAANASNYAADFHDISVGNNDYNNLNAGHYSATANYDLATGLGSYNAQALATALVSLAQSANGPRLSPTSMIWYFAEGSVGGGFQEWLTLQNPSAVQSSMVNVTYLFESRTSISISHTVAASSRATINVNQDLNIPSNGAKQAISMIVQVTSGPGIVAERPMYFTFHGISSGTDVLGATSPGTSYYFPVADTLQTGDRNYSSYITMLNPSTTQTATATVTFYTGACGLSGQTPCPTQTISVLPLHRGTVSPPPKQQMSVHVSTNLPMVVERPMYLQDNVPNAGGRTTGAASEVGATSPGTDWLFAEGYTGTDFQESLILANFGTTPTTATIKLEYTNASTQTLSVTVPAANRIFFDVNYANAHPTGICQPAPCTPTSSVSAEVTSTAPIVAERLMLFHDGPSHYPGVTEAVGEPGPASKKVFAFAEGYTNNTFQEFLTLQNPTANDETAAVTMFADTYVIEQEVIVKAHSRQTLWINGLIYPIASAYTNIGANSFAVSLTVQALGANAVLVAERPLYFDFYGDPGGTDIIGYTGG